MSKSKKNKFDRKAMRRFAVACAFAYDFVLTEAKGAEILAQKEQEEKEIEKIEKQKHAPDSVIINKSLGNGTRRRTKISREEYESKYAEILDIVSKQEETTTPCEKKPFDKHAFIQDVCSARIEDETDEIVIFEDLPDYNDYLFPVVSGIIDNIDDIDDIISRNSTSWSIDRMKKTDLAILRLSVFELKYFGNIVPLEVSINEAVEIAKAEDEKSGYFVNGVLAGIVRELKAN